MTMATRTLMTAAEFEKLPDDGNVHELDEGELIVMPPPKLRHGMVQKAVALALDQAGRKAGFGMVVTECGFRLARATWCRPRVATANSAPIWPLRFCHPTITQPDSSVK